MTFTVALSTLIGTEPAWAAGSLPGLGHTSRRENVDIRQPPWTILGRVQTGLGVRCSGFAVAPSVIMTAAHCLWLPATQRFISPEDVHFLLGYQRGVYSSHARVLRYILATGYDPRQEGRTAASDRATLVLDHPVIDRASLLPLVRPKVGQAAMLGGYQQDRAEVVLADRHCHILAAMAGGLIDHDCEGTRGASGAPLFVQVDGGWGIAGIVALAREEEGGEAVSFPP